MLATGFSRCTACSTKPRTVRVLKDHRRRRAVACRAPALCDFSATVQPLFCRYPAAVLPLFSLPLFCRSSAAVLPWNCLSKRGVAHIHFSLMRRPEKWRETAAAAAAAASSVRAGEAAATGEGDWGGRRGRAMPRATGEGGGRSVVGTRWRSRRDGGRRLGRATGEGNAEGDWGGRRGRVMLRETGEGDWAGRRHDWGGAPQRPTPRRRDAAETDAATPQRRRGQERTLKRTNGPRRGREAGGVGGRRSNGCHECHEWKRGRGGPRKPPTADTVPPSSRLYAAVAGSEQHPFQL